MICHQSAAAELVITQSVTERQFGRRLIPEWFIVVGHGDVREWLATFSFPSD